MESQVANNKEISQREMIAKFVHDVADMEVRALILRETVNKSKETISNELSAAENGYKKKVQKTEEAERDYNEQKVKRETSFSKYRKLTRSKGEIVGFCFLHFIAFVIIVSVLSVFEDLSPLVQTILQGVFLFTYGLIFYFVWHTSEKRSYQTYRGTEKEVVQKKKEFDEQRSLQDKAKVELEKKYKDNAEAEKRINALIDSITQIEQNLRECYSLDIIKPAYQNLVSVVILDEIFVNDKADTMREAMILCDAEIRHAELLGKLDQVMHALQTLSSTLAGMVAVLENINTNVELISRDVCSIAENQERIAYATESMQRSAENADFYIAQKRIGAL